MSTLTQYAKLREGTLQFAVRICKQIVQNGLDQLRLEDGVSYQSRKRKTAAVLLILGANCHDLATIIHVI